MTVRVSLPSRSMEREKICIDRYCVFFTEADTSLINNIISS